MSPGTPGTPGKAPGPAPGQNPWRILARFPHPEPQHPAPKARILPVFLPFAGCPQRCVFCDQAAQTGQAPEPLDALHQRLEAQLSLPAAPGAQNQHAQELAFYGGTFTALPEPWPRRFMELAGRFLASGHLTRIRCSTRPDAVDPARLAELKSLGLSLVELGVQSFDNAALSASQRGYDGQTARRACRAVVEAGLDLGIQLMPGLPGHTPAAFQADIAQAAAFAPKLARLYPCLVLAGTPLAERWRAGTYAPWGLDATVEQLALALPVLWAAGVPTARMGLAEQQGLAVLAGPRHPALGQMARSQALLAVVRQRLAELDQADLTRPNPPQPSPSRAQTPHAAAAESTAAHSMRPTILALPRRLQGEALGHKNALAPHYAALGLSLHFWAEDDMALCAQ